jgi:hypothetical protein
LKLPRGNKYGTAAPACRTFKGITFASRAEMNRYIELLAMERAGLIRDLELQPEYVLLAGYKHTKYGTFRPVRYRADFRYLETSTNRVITEDVKGVRTNIYKIKKTLLLWKYPDINLVEVKA